MGVESYPQNAVVGSQALQSAWALRTTLEGPAPEGASANSIQSSAELQEALILCAIRMNARCVAKPLQHGAQSCER
jgi:hypothetical protein